MATKKFGSEWTRSTMMKSALLFFVHFLILVVIIAGLILEDKFSDLRGHMKAYGADYLYALFCLFLLIGITYFYFLFENKELLQSGKTIALLFTVLELYFVLAWLIGEKINIYARPVAFVALMIFVLLGRREAIFMNIISALLVFVIDTFSGSNSSVTEYYSSLIISFSAGMIAIFFCSKARTRFHVVLIGILIVVPIDLILFLLELSALIEGTAGSVGLSPFESVMKHLGYGLFGGVMSTVIFLALLPIFESIFNRLTAFRLRELTSSDAKILRKLKEEAPGTYNHSMVVAQLAEASAAAIGENVDYARAAALYHDVGKLHYPEHFTENQGEYNLHDELTPELSADIIRSHAKDGYTLIKARHLPDFFADVAMQHHGTMPIRYFYAKALKMTDGELNIEDFSYLGPKPQTKIAAIIMIADASEAAVRAVGARNPEQAEKAIRAVIEERMDLEQFSECDITMADLTKIRQALVNALTGVYHHRIKYPNIKYRHTENGTKGETNE
ncbi:MAG: HD domain-containing protein [Clostridia bacterium]|nr:HD domain-containing protein [Clostridia bacterium]